MSAKLLTFSAMLAAAATGAFAAPQSGRFGCGTLEVPEEFKLFAEEMFVKEADDAARAKEMGEMSSAAAAATITVDTYFHVVAASQTASGGWIPESQLSAQLDVMNEAYAPHGIQFNLVETTRTVNAAWSRDGNERAMKNELRQGGYDALNLYFLTYVGGNFGYCYYPTASAANNPSSWAFTRDGCSILYSTVPGGSEEGYNLGHTVTHEAGHWFGLMHTFEGNSCSGSGDSVSDTPQQASASSGCPTGRDSCPNLAGVDPIHNYMDYTNDACYEEFTTGQQTRMVNSWNTYRA